MVGAFFSKHPDLSLCKSEEVSLTRAEGISKLEVTILGFWKRYLKKTMSLTCLFVYSTWTKLASN